MAPTERFPSTSADATALGQPLHFEFSGRTAPNRFLKAAMTERLSSWDPKHPETRGVPSAELINLYRRWGEGNWGVILTGNYMLDYDQLEAQGNAIVPKNAPHSGPRFEGFRAIAAAAKAHGSLIVAQVSHPGRQVSDKINKHPISAGDVQLQGNFIGMTFAKPRAMTEDDIADIIERFAQCGEYLEKTGHDGMQLHAAHGYLLAQFLSATTNQRTDKWGGSIENRARIILEIAQAVRARTRPDFILGIKMNSVEFQEKGLSPDEANQIAALLEANRFDFIELSGGTYEQLAFYHKRDSTVKREAYFIEFAEQIAPTLKKTKSYITGGLRTVGAMNEAIRVVDGVGFGRAASQEPRLVADILSGKITGTIAPKLDPADHTISITAAGTQLAQVGKDEEPADLSQQENVDALVKDVGAWFERLSKDGELALYGHPPLESVAAIPYGAATSAL